MGDFEQLKTRVHDLELKLVESSEEVREIKEDVRELRRLLELHFSSKEKSSKGAATDDHRSDLAESTSEQHVAAQNTIVPKYSRLEFPSYNGGEDPLGQKTGTRED